MMANLIKKKIPLQFLIKNKEYKETTMKKTLPLRNYMILRVPQLLKIYKMSSKLQKLLEM